MAVYASGMRRFIWIIVFTAATAQAGQVYRWVDENGVVHFSDMPHPGAEQVIIPESSTFTPPPVRRSTASSQPADTAAEPVYERLEIVTPAQEETLWNIEGQLNVSLDLEPALQPGHRLRLLLDGNPQTDLDSRNTSFVVPEVWRGTHTLQAQILDRNGGQMFNSPIRTFFVQQTIAPPPPIPSPAGPR